MLVKLKLASKSHGERERKGGEKVCGLQVEERQRGMRGIAEWLLGSKSVRSCLYLCFSSSSFFLFFLPGVPVLILACILENLCDRD